MSQPAPLPRPASIEHHLRVHPFLRDLGDERIAALADCSTIEKFPSGAIIFRREEEADRFLLVRTGMVTLELGPDEHHPLRVQSLHEGEVLGWSWLFDPPVWHFDARAQTPVQAIALDAACLRELCESDYELGFKLMQRIARVMADRLQASRRQLTELQRPSY